jgi:Polyphosphate kinase 2 (PPK2)
VPAATHDDLEPEEQHELARGIARALMDGCEDDFGLELPDWLSDLASRRRREQHTNAKEGMLQRAHVHRAPWWVVQAESKARLNCTAHLLTQMPYVEVVKPPMRLPVRVHKPACIGREVPLEVVAPERFRGLPGKPGPSMPGVVRARPQALEAQCRDQLAVRGLRVLFAHDFNQAAVGHALDLVSGVIEDEGVLERRTGMREIAQGVELRLEEKRLGQGLHGGGISNG